MVFVSARGATLFFLPRGNGRPSCDCVLVCPRSQFLTQIVRLGRLLSIRSTGTAFSAAPATSAVPTIDPFASIVAAAIASRTSDATGDPALASMGPVSPSSATGGGFDRAPLSPKSHARLAASGADSSSSGLLREFSPRSQTPMPTRRTALTGTVIASAAPAPSFHNRRMSTGSM